MDCNRFNPLEPIIIKSASSSVAFLQTMSFGSPSSRMVVTLLGSNFKAEIVS